MRWILDPIDGTVNYLYGLPQYAVSLAAEVDGVVVAGVVRNPATGDEWTATRAAAPGGTAGGWPARPRTDLDRAWSPPGSATTPRGARTRRGCWPGCPRVRDIRRFGAAALDLCLAAEGGSTRTSRRV